MAKQVKLTEGTLRALEILKDMEPGMTLEEINKDLEKPIAVAQLTSLRKNGFLDTVDVEKPVTRIQTVKAYTLTDAGREFDQE